MAVAGSGGKIGSSANELFVKLFDQTTGLFSHKGLYDSVGARNGNEFFNKIRDLDNSGYDTFRNKYYGVIPEEIMGGIEKIRKEQITVENFEKLNINKSVADSADDAVKNAKNIDEASSTQKAEPDTPNKPNQLDEAENFAKKDGDELANGSKEGGKKTFKERINSGAQKMIKTAGFSIGGLLTALAGAAAMWYFLPDDQKEWLKKFMGFGDDGKKDYSKDDPLFVAKQDKYGQIYSLNLYDGKTFVRWEETDANGNKKEKFNQATVIDGQMYFLHGNPPEPCIWARGLKDEGYHWVKKDSDEFDELKAFAGTGGSYDEAMSMFEKCKDEQGRYLLYVASSGNDAQEVDRDNKVVRISDRAVQGRYEWKLANEELGRDPEANEKRKFAYLDPTTHEEGTYYGTLQGFERMQKFINEKDPNADASKKTTTNPNDTARSVMEILGFENLIPKETNNRNAGVSSDGVSDILDKTRNSTPGASNMTMLGYDGYTFGVDQNYVYVSKDGEYTDKKVELNEVIQLMEMNRERNFSQANVYHYAAYMIDDQKRKEEEVFKDPEVIEKLKSKKVTEEELKNYRNSWWGDEFISNKSILDIMLNKLLYTRDFYDKYESEKKENTKYRDNSELQNIVKKDYGMAHEALEENYPLIQNDETFAPNTDGITPHTLPPIKKNPTIWGVD